jgi:molybdopterin/thiamine biosynthesis adenylyltransferase
VHVRNPRIKPIHHPVRTRDGRIRIGTVQYGVGSEIQGDADGAVWRLLGLMDGSRDIDAIVAEAMRGTPAVDAGSVRETIGALIDAGFVEDAGAPRPPQLGEDELERYASNTRYFAWVDTEPRPSPFEAQRRLKQSRVAVLGLGGTGGAIAMSLAAAGVGSMRCIDFDAVEVSNLSRQLMYREEDLGWSKVQTAVRRIRDLNRHVEVEGQELRVTGPDDLVEIMEDCDIFVLAADEPAPDIQLWTSEAALRTATPWAICQYAGPMIVTGLFVPFSTACYECYLASLRDENTRRDGGPAEPLLTGDSGNAVIAPTANATGHIGALEVIYFLTGLQPQTVGRVLHHNLMRYDHMYYIEAPQRPDCPACGAGRTPGQTRAIPTGGLG